MEQVERRRRSKRKTAPLVSEQHVYKSIVSLLVFLP